MILDKIVKSKQKVLNEAKKDCNINRLTDIIHKQPKVISFRDSLIKNQPSDIRIIAEVKKASPSKGVIRDDFDPIQIAKQYEQNNASAISVLTESDFFQGDLKYLKEIKDTVNIPVLRKDFIFDPYQVYEARANGADAVLLISSILEKTLLDELLTVAGELSLSALVEIHTKEELEKVLNTNAEIIGINNRNLKTFETDIQTTIDLMSNIPDSKIIVTESGIKTKADILKLSRAGVDAFLIGETFMREENPGDKLKEFII